MKDPLTDPLKQWIKPEIASLALAADGVRVDPSWQRLHWNENPYEFPTQLKEIVLTRLERAGWTPYPAALRPWALIECIAQRRGVDREQVVVGPGASDLIKVILGCVLRPGDTMVLPAPTFLLYRPGAQMQGAHCAAVPLAAENGFALPVDTLVEAAQTNNVRLTVVCAPNNPTGTVYSLGELAQLARGVRGLLLVDGAYAEFSGQDFTPLLAYENVILLHTFSKLYALAGARVGYALAAPAVARELQKAVSDFPLSTYAEIAAQVALEHTDLFMERALVILAERERLAAELRELPGVTVYPSGTNFLLVQLTGLLAGGKQLLLHHLLHDHGILISDLAAYPELPNCVRVSIGTHEQNRRLAQGMSERVRG